MDEFFAQLVAQNRAALTEALSEISTTAALGSIGQITEVAQELGESFQYQQLLQAQSDALGAYYGAQRPEFGRDAARLRERCAQAELDGWRKYF